MITDPMKEKPKNANRAFAKIGVAVRFLFPFMFIGVIWELLVFWKIVNLSSLPAPSTLLREFWNLAFVHSTLWHHLGGSLFRLAAGYGLAVLFGTGFGALLSQNRILHGLFEPTLNLLMSVPTIAWVPVLLITLGLGDKTVVTAIFISGFFPVTYNTMRGIEIIQPSIVNAGRMMGLHGVKLFSKILFPASMLSVINGLRLALGYAWRALVGAEILAALIEWGVGKMIYQARYFNDVAVMMVGLLVVGVCGYLLDQIFLVMIERNTVEKWGLTRKK